MHREFSASSSASKMTRLGLHSCTCFWATNIHPCVYISSNTGITAHQTTSFSRLHDIAIQLGRDGDVGIEIGMLPTHRHTLSQTILCRPAFVVVRSLLVEMGPQKPVPLQAITAFLAWHLLPPPPPCTTASCISHVCQCVLAHIPQLSYR